MPPSTSSTSWGYTVFSGLGLSLTYDQSQKFVGRASTQDGTFDVASATMASGAWHHLVLVRDQAAGQLHLYLDGSAVAGSSVAFTGSFSVAYAPLESNHGQYYNSLRIGVSDPLFHSESNQATGPRSTRCGSTIARCRRPRCRRCTAANG